MADKEAEIASLEAQAEAENDNLERKEALFNQADELKKEVYKITENILNEILPEAFAVVKETARRFAENPVLEVTAQPFDRHVVRYPSQCDDRRRSCALEQYVGCGRKARYVGHGALRRAADRRRGLAPG